MGAIPADSMKKAAKIQTDRAVHWGLGIGAVMIVAALAWQEYAGKFVHQSEYPSLAKKWEFTAGGGISGALALSHDGTLYAAGKDGDLYALDPGGNLKWKLQIAPMEATPAIGSDGTVYVTDIHERIYAINPNGTQQWANGGGPFAKDDLGSLSGAVDSTFLYTPWRGQVREIRLTTGNFDEPVGLNFEVGGAVILLPNRLILHPGNGRLEAVDSTGRTQWEYPAPNPPVTVDMLLANGGRAPAGNFWLDSAMAVAADGTIYAAASGSRLVALTGDGAFKWEFKTRMQSLNRATPVIAPDGTVYFGSGEGILYALNSDGILKWTANLNGAVAASPLLAEDETIFMISGSTLVAVSPDGRVIAEAAIGGSVESSPTLAPEGTIYVATSGGRILAFAGGHGPLLDSPWPKFQWDLSNSGRAPAF